MSVRRSLLVLLLFTILLPIAVLYLPARSASRQALDLSSLQLYEVRPGDVTRSVSAIGTISAAETVSLSFLSTGRVAHRYYQQDDYVLQGDVLLELDNRSQRLAYEQAVLNLEVARLELEDLQTVDEADIRIAEANVDSAWGAFLAAQNAVSEADIQAAELSYERALEAIEDAERQRDVIGGQTGGDSAAYQAADARVGEATFNAEIARLQLESLRTRGQPQQNAAYNRVLQAQAELERVKSGPSSYEIRVQEVAIQRAEAQVERASTAYERTLLRAPFDGVISALNIEEGAVVVPGAPVVEITSVDSMSLTAQVDEIDIGLVEVGQPVRVVLDALPDVELPARLTAIAPAGTNQGGIVTYDVDIALEVVDPRARVGMTAEATIIIEERQDVLLIPNLYIRRDRQRGTAFVNVLRPDDTIDEVEVELGLIGQESSEVRSGLQAGDLIAIDRAGGGLADLLGN